MSRVKCNSDSLQIGSQWQNSELQQQNRETYNKEDIQSNDVGVFSFRNIKANSIHSKNDVYELDYGQLSKQFMQSNENTGTLPHPSNHQNQNQSLNQSFVSYQSLSINPGASLQTFGNTSNQRKYRDSSNSLFENKQTQLIHQKQNVDSKDRNNNNGYKTGYQEIGYQLQNQDIIQNIQNLTGQNTQQHNNMKFQILNTNRSNSLVQSQLNEQNQYISCNNSYISTNNYEVELYKNRESSQNSFIQNNNSNSNDIFYNQIQQSINQNATNKMHDANNQGKTNNSDYQKGNQNNYQTHQYPYQSNQLSNYSLKKNNYLQQQNNFLQQQGNNNNSNNIYPQTDINLNKINMFSNKNVSIDQRNQIHYQSQQDNQKNNRLIKKFQNNNSNQQQSLQNYNDKNYNQLNQSNQNQFQSQQNNQYNEEQNISYSNQMWNIQGNNNNSVQSNSALNQYSQTLLGQEEKQYISFDKSQQQLHLNSMNSHRNNQSSSNNFTLEFASPKSEQVINFNTSIQSQKTQINPQKLRQNSLGNINLNIIGNLNFNPKVQVQRIEQKGMLAKELTGKSNPNPQRSPDDEFLQKYKKIQNNEFTNRPQSNNPENKRKYNTYYYPHAELNLTDNNAYNKNNTSLNKDDPFAQRFNLNVSNNSFTNLQTNPNNNSLLIRKMSKVSEYINYPTHSKRKIDGGSFLASDKKDTSRYESSLVLTKKKDVDSQLHFVGSPFSPQGLLDNLSQNNSYRYPADGILKSVKNEDIVTQFNMINNSSNYSNGLVFNNFKSKNINTSSNKFPILSNEGQSQQQQIPLNSGRDNILSNNNSSNKIFNDHISYETQTPKVIKQELNKASFDLTPKQGQIQNKDNRINNQKDIYSLAQTTKDQFGRSQSAGLIYKKQKIFTSNMKPNINNSGNQYQSALVNTKIDNLMPQNQISSEIFLMDQDNKAAKKEFFEDNLKVLMKGDNLINDVNKQSSTLRGIKQSKPNDTEINLGISPQDEDNLKKYIQLQQNINVSPSQNSNDNTNNYKKNYQSMNIIKSSRNQTTSKIMRCNSKELFTGNKYKSSNLNQPLISHKGYPLSKNQEQVLKQKTGEQQIQKLGQEKNNDKLNLGYNTLGNKKIENVLTNLKEQQNNNYKNMKYTIASTLPTSQDVQQTKIAKHTDHFIKKNSLPTQHNKVYEENTPQKQQYNYKNNVNRVNLKNNNPHLNKPSPSQQRNPRIKIFEREHSQNKSNNQIEKLNDKSPSKNQITPNQSFINKSPFFKDVETETEEFVTTIKSKDFRNSSIIANNTNQQTNNKQIASKNQFDLKENFIIRDQDNQNFSQSNKPMDPKESRYDGTQTSYQNPQIENKNVGMQQIKQKQGLQQQSPFSATDYQKQFHNSNPQNLNQNNYINYNQKKMNSGNNILTTQEQDAYLDRKYGKCIQNISRLQEPLQMNLIQ